MPKASISLDIVDQNKGLLRKVGLKLSEVRRQLLLDIATFWHRQIMPEHFTSANRRYEHEDRTEGYLKGEKKKKGVGQGKYVFNLLTGRTVRMMLHLATFSKPTDQVRLTMPAPSYFTNPYVGPIKTATREFTIRRQPDKVREVTQFVASDFERMGKFGRDRLQELVDREILRGAARAA